MQIFGTRLSSYFVHNTFTYGGGFVGVVSGGDHEASLGVLHSTNDIVAKSFFKICQPNTNPNPTNLSTAENDKTDLNIIFKKFIIQC